MITGQVQVCACCAECGERYTDPIEMTVDDVAEPAGLKAVGSARVFVSVCDLGCVFGVQDQKYEYDVEVAVSEAGSDRPGPS